MKNKGQALVEFIIILPILIIIMLGIIDFYMIFSNKNSLENILDEVVLVWKENKTTESINAYLKENENNILYEFVENKNTVKITLKKDYEIIMPGLNKILTNPYTIRVSRVIYNEK